MTDGYLCGWRVHSELDLPELVPWKGENRAPDIVIRLGEVPRRLDGLIEDGPFLQIDRRGVCLLRLDNVASYLVPSSCEVIVAPRFGTTDVEIRVFLLSSVLGLLCHKRGLLPLRASCIAIDGKAVVLCGPTGAGKSTAAAQFALRGHPLLADDVCAIDAHAAGGPQVLPAFPRLKLWRDSLDALGIACDGLQRNRQGQNKFHYLHDRAFPVSSVPLGKILLLLTAFPNRTDECVMLTRPAERIAALEVYCRQAAAATGRMSELLAAQTTIAATTPIWRVTRRFVRTDMDRALRPIKAALAA